MEIKLLCSKFYFRNNRIFPKALSLEAGVRAIGPSRGLQLAPRHRPGFRPGLRCRQPPLRQTSFQQPSCVTVTGKF